MVMLRERARLLAAGVLLAALLCLPIAAGADGGENLLTNPSFETVGSNGLPSGWSTDAYLRTEGYEVADEQTFGAFFDQTHENQNRLSKQHVCLVPFADLQATSDYVHARSQKASDQDYEHLDDVIVLHLKDIANDRERSN